MIEDMVMVVHIGWCDITELIYCTYLMWADLVMQLLYVNIFIDHRNVTVPAKGPFPDSVPLSSVSCIQCGPRYLNLTQSDSHTFDQYTDHGITSTLIFSDASHNKRS